MFSQAAVLLAALVAVSVNDGNAFVPNGKRAALLQSQTRLQAPPSPVVVCMSDIDDSSPSDSGSEIDDIVVDTTATATSSSSNSNSDLIDGVMSEFPSTILGVSKEMRSKMNEALLKLEAINPTPNPTLSPLLNGVWELKYSGGYAEDWSLPSPTRQLALFLYSGGYSPGLFALALAQQLPKGLVEVGDLEISISRSQPRIEAKVGAKLLGGAENFVSVKARLEVDSDLRFTETYESATVLGNDVTIPDALQYSRDLYVTYVDEDLLVVRDASGVPEVLVRKEKDFGISGGTEPSEVEPMAAPGEEDW